MESHGKTISLCPKCFMALEKNSGDCKDGHALTCCGSRDGFHKTTCPEIVNSVGYKLGQRMAAAREKAMLDAMMKACDRNFTADEDISAGDIVTNDGDDLRKFRHDDHLPLGIASRNFLLGELVSENSILKSVRWSSPKI